MHCLEKVVKLLGKASRLIGLGHREALDIVSPGRRADNCREVVRIAEASTGVS